MSWIIEQGLRVRPMGERDFEFVTELRMVHNKYFIHSVSNYKESYKYLNGVLNDPFDLVFIIEREDQPEHWIKIGCFSIDDEGHNWHQAEFGRCMMMDIYKGVGLFARAAKYILDWAREFIDGQIWLECFTWNTRAIVSYKRLDFVTLKIKGESEKSMVIMEYKGGK